MKLVIIDGPTATGKTTLARKLAKDLNIATFLKDDYKEREFDRLGKKPNAKQMSQIEKMSWQEVFSAVAAAVKNNRSLIIEGNFYKSHGKEIKKVLNADTIVVEIFCHASGFVIFKRFVDRNRRGEKHEGHRDHLLYPLIMFEAFFLGFKHYRSLELSANILKVNTTDFANIDYETIRKFIVSAR